MDISLNFANRCVLLLLLQALLTRGADIVSATSLDMFTARLNSIDSSRLLSSFKMYFHAIVFSAFRVRVRVFQ